ncbi:MAG TPA: ATP-binding protein [Kiritimatiellia bacterium]|nr:ATP-binding protein [Kiritimatiellia bacterium]HRU71583.1 ATP-binding protein [Kiritimatiellia bacterium]
MRSAPVDEAPDSDVARGVDEMLRRWRAVVIDRLHKLATVLLLPPLLLVLAGRGVMLSWPLRGFLLLNYLVLLASTVHRSLDPRIRAGILLGLIASTGVVRLAVGQLAGSGRLSLLVMPLLALLLVGPRAGWAAAALSLALYAATPVLLHGGGFAIIGIPAAAPAAPPAFWMLQGASLAAILLTLLVLFTYFLRLQRRTMIAERAAHRQWEQEVRRRRQLEEAIGRLGAEERRRLGAELHDGLCQQLTAALLRCTGLEQARGASDAPRVSELAQIRASIQESIDTAYEVAKGLCPVGMDADALVPALERLCQEVRKRHGKACRLLGDRDVAIRNPEHALLWYQIAREAVTNAVKHARCKHISIALERVAGGLEMRVTDDGRGPATEATPATGMGLSIMRYRAGLLGGTLRIGAGENGGFEVACRVPLLEDTR